MGRSQNITLYDSWPSDKNMDSPILETGKMKKTVF